MFNEEDERVEYAVALTDEAFYSYASIPSERVFQHVEHDLELLAEFPELGQIYDPAYPAARPPFECRVLYCEHLGIFYQVRHDKAEVMVFAIEDQRRNPQNRFESIVYGVEPLDASE